MDPQGHDAVTDAALDGEIRRALAVDPSPEFLARVRMRIASEPKPADRRFWWLAATASVAAVVVLAVVIGQRGSIRDQRAAPGVLTARSSVGIGSLMPTSVEIHAAPSRLAPPKPPIDAGAVPQAFRPALRGREAPTREVEVLIAQDEARALRQLIAGVRDGRIDLTPVLASTPITGVDTIAIEPITIEPIGPPTGEQGVRQ